MRREPIEAEYLRRLLRQANLTQREAAELIGVGFSTMKRYLHRKPCAIRRSGLIILEAAAKRAQNEPFTPAGN